MKTLQDRPRLLRPRRVTLRYLVTRAPPASLPETRLPFELRVFVVDASVTLVRTEYDGDVHFVLRSGGDQMIAESPSPSCTTRATPLRRQQMAAARRLVRVCRHATIRGVAFFDFSSGQTGIAPNAIELHSVLGFRCNR